MPTARLHRGLVALSASAIAAVYMGGYLRTQSADASIGAAADNPVAAHSVPVGATAAPAVAPPRVPATPAGSTAVTVRPRVAATATPGAARAAPTPQATPSAPTQGTYKDGTYTGQGSSRRGGVAVSVVVQGGRIVSVTITQSTLQYPLRDIAGLPAQVVQRQTAQVDTVSRATYSSQAFKGAVTQALSKAG
ncbi:MAG: FMN-binding protein [Chloroflexota bacterium]|nr:FMN-binding protein [Chloroflexota bacterium]